MAPSRVLAAVVLSAALAVPATAGAADRGSGGSRANVPTPLGAAAAAGQRHWGAVPCKGQIKLLTQRPPVAGIDPGSDAWVTFDSSLGANDLAAPANSYTNCTITFARRRWPTSASMKEDWDMFCATMTHELGHLLGHSHDASPGSLMAPVFTDYSGVPAICRATRPVLSGRRGR